MFTAVTGATLAPALRPDAVITAPTITPIRLVQLYSTAGARLNVSREPDRNCTRVGDRSMFPPGCSIPSTFVVSLCWYATSSASTQLRVRLYSQAEIAENDAPGSARPRKPVFLP